VSVVTLDLELGRDLPGDPVEEDGFVDRRDERMADAPQHRVVRPHRQLVAASRLERGRTRAASPALAGSTVRHTPRFDVLRGDDGTAPGGGRSRHDQPRGMEDLHRPVRVERRDDLRIAPRFR
jgi:hypothetical protein